MTAEEKIAHLLEVRKELSSRRPKFLRQDYHYRLKVHDDTWRAPKGRHSKMRRKEKGKRAVVQIGYRGPKAVRGLHKSGASFVHINSLKDLEKVNPKTNICILGGKLGKLAKYKILKEATVKGIKFSNVDAEKFLKNFEEKLALKSAAKQTNQTDQTKQAKQAKQTKTEGTK